jgi:phosphohistidine phosphatase
MDVYLVRHAIADHRDPARWPDDAKRPLTTKGIARFRSAARGLNRIVPDVDVVLASPYTRAWQTGEILHDEAGWPAPEPCPALEAIRPPVDAVEVLQASSDRSSVALVGHEPYLSRLASLLLCGDADALPLELKKGGVVLLRFGGDPSRGGALLRWSASPRILRSLDGPVSPS